MMDGGSAGNVRRRPGYSQWEPSGEYDVCPSAPVPPTTATLEHASDDRIAVALERIADALEKLATRDSGEIKLNYE